MTLSVRTVAIIAFLLGVLTGVVALIAVSALVTMQQRRVQPAPVMMSELTPLPPVRYRGNTVFLLSCRNRVAMPREYLITYQRRYGRSVVPVPMSSPPPTSGCAPPSASA